jgi:hypothetical protein
VSRYGAPCAIAAGAPKASTASAAAKLPHVRAANPVLTLARL